MSKAILIVSHGSRSPRTKEELSLLVRALRQKSNIDLIFDAYLELESPSIPEGIDRCVQQGAHEIIVALNFLNSGKHVDQDIPVIVTACRAKYPHISIHITPPLGQHPSIPEVFLDLIKQTKS